MIGNKLIQGWGGRVTVTRHIFREKMMLHLHRQYRHKKDQISATTCSCCSCPHHIWAESGQEQPSAKSSLQKPRNIIESMQCNWITFTRGVCLQNWKCSLAALFSFITFLLYFVFLLAMFFLTAFWLNIFQQNSFTAVLLFLNVRVNSYPKDVLVHLHMFNFSPVHLFGTESIRFSCSFFTFFLLFFCCHLYFNWLPSSHQFKSKYCSVKVKGVFPSKAVIADVVKYLAEQSDICQMLAVGCRTHTNILPLHDWVSNTHQISFKYQKTSPLFNNVLARSFF